MKKIILSLATIFALSACTAPTGTNPSASPSSSTGTGNNGTLSGRIATKAEFVSFLNCLKNQPDVDAQAKSAIDLQIQAVAIIPDYAWAQAGAAYGSFLDSYSKYETVCR